MEGRGAEIEGTQLLVTLLEQLVEGQYDLWQQVAGRRELLRGGLRQAVQEASSSAEDVGPLLKRCWELLTDDRAVLRVAEFYRRDPDYEQVPVDHELVLRGALRLLATAQAAVAARQVATVPDATARLEEWSRVAVELFATSSQPPGRPLGAELVKDPAACVRQTYKRFGGQAGGALFWTLEWLEATAAVDVMKVPVVGYHPSVGGFCADLRLRLIEGKGELVEHPDMALRPLGPELREVILDAYRAAAPGGGTPSSSWFQPRRSRRSPGGPLHPVGEPPGESPAMTSVCWSLNVRDRNLDPLVPLDGGSLSGAARTGLLLLRARQGYDTRSVIVAKADTGGQLRPVGFERDKLEAAAASSLRQAIVAPGDALSEADRDDLQIRGLKLRKVPDVPSALKLVRAHRRRRPIIIATAIGLAAVGAILLLIGYLTAPPPNLPGALDMVYRVNQDMIRIYQWRTNGLKVSNPTNSDSLVAGSFNVDNVASRMVSGDVNGDGTNDIVMAYQNADGTFSYHVWLNGTDYAGKWYTSGKFTLGLVGDRLTVGDYDGDHEADVAMAYDRQNGQMSIYRWTSTGLSFSNLAISDPGVTGPFNVKNVAGRIASGDVNGDHKDDIVMAYQNDDGTFSCYVWLNGIDYAGKWYTSPGKFNFATVGDRFTVGDYNGDGLADVAMAYHLNNSEMRIDRLISTGSGFSNLTTSPVLKPFHPASVAGRMVSGDVNGDHKDDIVMAYQNADQTFSYYVWLNGINYDGKWYTSPDKFNLSAVGDRFTW
jgi:hypothetical protein